MTIKLAPKPTVYEFVVWTGTNVDEVNEYLARYVMAEQSATIVANEDGTARIERTGYPDNHTPVNVDNWIRAEHAMWGGPMLEVSALDEVNAKYFPYPDHPAVVEPPSSDV